MLGRGLLILGRGGAHVGRLILGRVGAHIGQGRWHDGIALYDQEASERLTDICNFVKQQMTISYSIFDDTVSFVAMLNRVRGKRSATRAGESMQT